MALKVALIRTEDAGRNNALVGGVNIRSLASWDEAAVGTPRGSNFQSGRASIAFGGATDAATLAMVNTLTAFTTFATSVVVINTYSHL
jgi:hypothetical protein